MEEIKANPSWLPRMVHKLGRNADGGFGVEAAGAPGTSTCGEKNIWIRGARKTHR